MRDERGRVTSPADRESTIDSTGSCTVDGAVVLNMETRCRLPQLAPVASGNTGRASSLTSELGGHKSTSSRTQRAS